MRPHLSFRFLALIALSGALTACPRQTKTKQRRNVEFTTAPNAIIGGVLESGWPGVGALTRGQPGVGYGGSFCTGTLISPEWVLTAAHCLSASPDFTPNPYNTRFYLGNDASVSQPAGAFYQPDRFVIHPGYAGAEQGDDIALMHLSSPVPNATTYSYNSLNLAPYVGDSAEYIGYGVSDGVAQTGGGLKRSTSMDIGALYPEVYYSEFDGGGICFGDSGGPAMLLINGAWRIVGVNSAVAGPGEDPCREFYVSVRVDAYASWISAELNLPAPDCRAEVGTCLCEAACQANGSCDQSACEVLSCGEIYECLTDCGDDDGCQSVCYVEGTEEGSAQLSAMFECMRAECEDLEGEAYSACVTERCAEEVEACFPRVFGEQSCAEISECLFACPNGDAACQQGCFEEGTEPAQDAYIELTSCYAEQCSDTESNAEFSSCVEAECLALYFACYPPDDCPLSGGGCDEGEACYPGFGGRTGCYPSDGRELGESCPLSADQLSCGDGLICYRDTCEAMCLTDDDCPAESRCSAPIFEGLDEGGLCVGAEQEEPVGGGVPPRPAGGMSGEPEGGSEGGGVGSGGSEAGAAEGGVATEEGGDGSPQESGSSEVGGGTSPSVEPEQGGATGFMSTPASSAGAVDSSSCQSVSARPDLSALTLLLMWLIMGLRSAQER